MCDKAVDTYRSTIEYVPDWFRTQEMCSKAVDKCPFAFDSVPDQYKTQEMCDKIVSDDSFKLNIVILNIRLKKCLIKPLMIFYQH